MTLKWNIIEM